MLMAHATATAVRALVPKGHAALYPASGALALTRTLNMTFQTFLQQTS